MTNPISRRGLAAFAALAPLAFVGSARAEGPESTFERVTRTKVLRIAALPGEAPYFFKDIATGEWSGAAIDMAKSIAAIWEAKLEYVESTYGNSVLDLQSNKVDVAFALNPTPARALSIGFTKAMIIHPFGCVAKKGFNPANWEDINKPEIRIAVDLGSLHETSARRFAPKAQITAYKTRDECVLAVQSGRADCVIMAVALGLTAVAKNPNLGEFIMLTGPRVQLPTCMGVRQEPDKRWRDFLSAWVDFNRGIGQIREWMYAGLELNGVKPETIPADVEF